MESLTALDIVLEAARERARVIRQIVHTTERQVNAAEGNLSAEGNELLEDWIEAQEEEADLIESSCNIVEKENESS